MDMMTSEHLPQGAASRTPTGELSRFASAAEMAQTLTPRDPVYCLYPHRLHAAFHRFQAGFKGDVLYAVKVNPEPAVLRQLYAAGLRHFDTASLAEIALIAGLFPDAQCHYMAPMRPLGALEEAYKRFGVRDFALDCADELETLLKVADKPGETTAFVRLATVPHGAMFELSSKFGSTPEESAALVNRARDHGLKTALTFHVGSQSLNPAAFAEALQRIGETLAMIKGPIDYLDVGGGFPAPYPGLDVPPLEDFLAAIARMAVALGLPKGTRLMAEPGRILVADGLSLLAQVILRKGDKLYLNDGVYGSFMEAKIPGALLQYPARALGPHGNETVDYTLYGPTCDSYDVVPGTFALPADLKIGDYVEFGMMGAYATAMRTHFNGFYPSRFVEIGAGSEPPLA